MTEKDNTTASDEEIIPFLEFSKESEEYWKQIQDFYDHIRKEIYLRMRVK